MHVVVTQADLILPLWMFKRTSSPCGPSQTIGAQQSPWRISCQLRKGRGLFLCVVHLGICENDFLFGLRGVRIFFIFLFPSFHPLSRFCSPCSIFVYWLLLVFRVAQQKSSYANPYGKPIAKSSLHLTLNRSLQRAGKIWSLIDIFSQRNQS